MNVKRYSPEKEPDACLTCQVQINCTSNVFLPRYIINKGNNWEKCHAYDIWC